MIGGKYGCESDHNKTCYVISASGIIVCINFPSKHVVFGCNDTNPEQLFTAPVRSG